MPLPPPPPSPYLDRYPSAQHVATIGGLDNGIPYAVHHGSCTVQLRIVPGGGRRGNRTPHTERVFVFGVGVANDLPPVNLTGTTVVLARGHITVRDVVDRVVDSIPVGDGGAEKGEEQNKEEPHGERRDANVKRTS